MTAAGIRSDAQAWHALGEADRAEWRAKARSDNAVSKGSLLARTQEAPPTIAASGLAPEHEYELDPPSGPWSIASARGKYPIHLGVIEEQQRIANMIETERMWNATWEPKIKAAKDVPSTTSSDGPISAAAAETPKNCEDVVAAMLRIVRYSLKYGVETDSPLGMLFEFRDGESETSKYAFVSHYQSLDKVDFEAEFLRMQPIHEAELPELSFNRTVSPGTEQPLLDISTERDFVVSLVREQSEPRVWDVYNLSWTVLNIRPRAGLGWYAWCQALFVFQERSLLASGLLASGLRAVVFSLLVFLASVRSSLHLRSTLRSALWLGWAGPIASWPLALPIGLWSCRHWLPVTPVNFSSRV